jgi:hypothetical protein
VTSVGHACAVNTSNDQDELGQTIMVRLKGKKDDDDDDEVAADKMSTNNCSSVFLTFCSKKGQKRRLFVVA